MGNELKRIRVWQNGSRTSARGPAQNFTGSVIVDPLFDATDHTHASGALVTFEPGARTAWHTHPAGQTLIVTWARAGLRNGAANGARSSRVTWSGFRRTSSTGMAARQPIE